MRAAAAPLSAGRGERRVSFSASAYAPGRDRRRARSRNRFSRAAFHA